jgi:hypothetical protein|tara:strand:- start:161 stop:550 length:390 start_codon:yes stop_codon:yes gene_type:complete
MDVILKKIQEITREVLKIEFKQLKELDIPKQQGVYIIKNIEKNEIFYVGKSKNLYNRIIKAHIKGELPSSLREKLNKKGLSNEKELGEYLENNCLFVIKHIEDFDINNLVEDLLISILRKKGEPLLNTK